METYALADQKGGVGKTAVTLGLAAALTRKGARTLLVDLDPQASATKVLGIDGAGQCSVADVLLEPARFGLSQAIIRTGWELSLAPAETALASREARRCTADEFILRDQLRRLAGFDVVLIDCPPSLGLSSRPGFSMGMEDTQSVGELTTPSGLTRADLMTAAQVAELLGSPSPRFSSGAGMGRSRGSSSGGTFDFSECRWRT